MNPIDPKDQKMPKGLLGKKIGMSRCFNESGEVVPVTFIEAGPCKVLQVKTADKDGYPALQLGFDNKRQKTSKTKTQPLRFIKEVGKDAGEEIKPGQQLTVDVFKQGEFVDITGKSIGKGFQGGMKRWNWSGGKASHGSTTHRRPGSIGASAYPSRVVKGHHMPGHMGNEWVTVQNLEVVEIHKEDNILVIKGAVPGPKGNYLLIRKALKGKKPVRKEEPKAEEKKQAKPKKKK